MGPTVTGIITQSQDGTTFPGGEIDCTVTGYTRLHDSGLYSVRAVVNCNWGFAYYANFQPERFDLTAHDGSDSDSNPCRFRAMSVAISENTNTELTLTAVLQSEGPPPPGCNLTAGTLDLEAGINGGEISPIEFPWALGAMPESPVVEPGAPFECQGWRFYPPEVVTAPTRRSIPVGGTTYEFIEQTVRYKVQKISPTASTYPILSAYFVVSGLPNTQYRPYTNQQFAALPNEFKYSGTNDFVFQSRSTSQPELNESGGFFFDGNTSFPAFADASWNSQAVVSRDIVVEVGEYSINGTQIPQSLRIEGAGYWWTSTNTSRGWGHGRTVCGQSEPSAYWGHKIRPADHAAYGAATPLGTMPEPAAGPSEVEEPDTIDNPDPGSGDGSCEGFSFTDPTSWAGAGICVLVKAVKALLSVMQNVLGVLGGMVAGIVNGLLDGIEALFIPSDGFLDGKVEEVQDAWAGTPPGVVMDDLGDVPDLFTGPSSTGCAGPPLEVDLPLSEDSTTLHLFSTCEDWSSNLATITNLCLRLGVYFGAFLVALRVLAASFGLSLSFGGGDD